MIFVGVVGNKNSGKSSIIQSISGCKSPVYNDFMYDKTTNESIYVVCSSPQELTLEYSKLANFDAIKKLIEDLGEKKNCRGLIMALWPNNPSVKPSIEKIYGEIASKSSGFSSSYCFVVDPGYKKSKSIFKIVEHRLVNISLTLPPIQISGEEFPFKNATKINKITSLIY